MRPLTAIAACLAIALHSLTGCGAHTRPAQPAADVMRGAITPVASSAPVGVLTPVGGGSTQSSASSIRITREPSAAPSLPASTLAPAVSPAPAVTPVPGSALSQTAMTAPVVPAAAPATTTRLSSPSGNIDVERVPEAVTVVPYVYPQPAREAGVHGTVLLLALVGADGNVYDARVLRSIPMLDAAAKAALKQWKFKPAIAGGKSVAVWFSVPIEFTLN